MPMKVVSNLSAEDVKLLPMPPGYQLVTEHTPLEFDNEQGLHYMVVALYSAGEYGVTYVSQPHQYIGYPTVAVAKRLPAEKFAEYVSARLDYPVAEWDYIPLRHLVAEVRDEAMKFFPQDKLSSLFQLMNQANITYTLLHRGVHTSSMFPLPELVCPNDWTEIIVSEPLPEEFTVYADYYEAPLASWVLHYGVHKQLFTRYKEEHCWAFSAEPIARLMYIGKLPHSWWFDDTVINLRLDEVRKFYGELSVSPRVQLRGMDLSVSELAVELISKATPKELQNLLERYRASLTSDYADDLSDTIKVTLTKKGTK